MTNAGRTAGPTHIASPPTGRGRCIPCAAAALPFSTASGIVECSGAGNNRAGAEVSRQPGRELETLEATYVVPLRRDRLPIDRTLVAYLNCLAGQADVIAVDGSPPPVFVAHARALSGRVRHIPPRGETPNGKVAGVLTGLEHARYERVVIADDDVRYTWPELRRVVELLDEWDVVRPQNYFEPLPWHARWDTARSLLNRVSGGDWPGTLAVRRSILTATGGYAGDILFENFELVRTVRAAGGRELVALDLFVRRLPPTFRHFRSQRVRQAYDELARPLRLICFLTILPTVTGLIARRAWGVLAACGGLTVLVAEAGRRRGNGRRVFRPGAALAAPFWLLERGVCVWIALAGRLVLGGVPYRGGTLRRAATPRAELRRRHGGSVPRATGARP